MWIDFLHLNFSLKKTKWELEILYFTNHNFVLIFEVVGGKWLLDKI